MQENLKVSILCTAYNHEKYISQALDSFLAQNTDFKYEILVTDDASTDATSDILEEYANNYPGKIKWFHQEENAFSKYGIGWIYYNILFPNAKGEYIAFCEGDDFWCSPDKLQIQADFLDSHKEYSACVHNSWNHYCDENKSDDLLIQESKDQDVAFSKIIQGLHISFHTSSIMARKNIISNIPDYERVAGTYGFLDYAWALHLCLNGKIFYFDKVMSVYRHNGVKESWRYGYEKNYAKKTHYVEGEIAMMNTLLNHVSGEEAKLVKEEIKKREYELCYLKGETKKMLQPAWRELFNKEPLNFKVKIIIKILFPKMHKYYREKKGFIDE